MKKILLLFASVFAVFFTADAQLLQEQFNFSGALNANGWGVHSGAATNVLSTVPGLSYADYIGSGVGNAVLVSSLGGEDANLPLSDSLYTDGDVIYTSFLVNVTDTASNKTGDYFFHLGNRMTATTFTSFASRVFAKIVNGSVNFGISNLSTAGMMRYAEGTYAKNTTYLIILKYTINTSGVDEVRMWVKASGIPMSEDEAGTPTVIADSVNQLGQDIIDAVALRQGSNTTSVGLIVDGIRVAKTWGLKKVYDDPAKIMVKNAEAPVNLDGKLDEADWNNAPALLFGNGAHLKKQAGDMTVTGGFDLKATFDVNAVTYHLPNTDSSWARVKFIRKGMDLYLGVQSNDKSICRFDWEGEGVFVQIKDNSNVTKEYKLYYQNIAGNKDTIRYEESVLNSGGGAGFLPVGSTANDTTNVDNGYTAELRIRLDKLGYAPGVNAVQFSMNIFDPDGFQFNSELPWPYGMSPWDSARGSYFKSWYGSEWGSSMRTLELSPEIVKFDDPAKVVAKNAEAPVNLDGKLDEADWANAPALLFGNGAHLKKQGGDMTVTGGFDLKATFDVNAVTYHIPNVDSSWARVKFIRKGMDLYLGIQSNDKSICRFDWEGEGLFVQIKDNANVTKEYKLYYQNIAGNKDTIKYEESVLNSGGGAGFLPAGSSANDTTNVDNGYTAELRIRLDKLGYAPGVNAVQISMNIFDPDGFQFNSELPWPYGMSPWDSARGSYFKSWWGSEWGSAMKTVEFVPEVIKYDDPMKLMVKNSDAGVTLDGKLDEADWNGAPSLLFGNGAHMKKQGGDKTGTGGFDIKGSFDVGGTTYHIPNMDSSWLRVKFLRKGTDLFIGMQSNDKSICKFDWEGDGLFLKIKNSAGDDKEYKLYWQNIEGNKDTIRYEEGVLNSGQGAGFLNAGSTVNDTLNVDNGYSAELRLKLSSLGYTNTVGSVQVAMAMFDPDGFKHPMNSWDSARGSYYKSWWGSEWGGTYRTLEFTPPFDNPDTVMAKIASSAMTLDGKLNESDWATANTLVFGPSNAPKTGTEKTVTGGFDIKGSFDVGGITYHLPYKDTSYTKVKFLAKGNDLYIGIQSPDKSICKFDWEGDGLFLKIKNSAGDDKEYKLYWQNIEGNKDTIRYEEGVLNSGQGAGSLAAGSTVNDTMNVDNGYTAELRIKLNSLGFAASANKVNLTVAMAIFDPDGYQHPMNAWDSARGSYYKSWWGSEWGGSYRTITLPNTTGVQELEGIPMTFALHQNYPNPFNPATTIRYAVALSSPVVLTIYNLLGQEITTLVNKEQKPGNYEVNFDASRFASGIYIYRIQAGSFVETKKMMLIK